jgi:hypothetical protein
MAAGFLVSNAPVTHRAVVPAIHLAFITPGPRGKTRYSDLLKHTPETETEKLLQWALRHTEAQEAVAKNRVVSLQATLVLWQRYCERVRGQLETHTKKKKKKEKGRRIKADGMPRLLTGDRFFG